MLIFSYVSARRAFALTLNCGHPSVCFARPQTLCE